MSECKPCGAVSNQTQKSVASFSAPFHRRFLFREVSGRYWILVAILHCGLCAFALSGDLTPGVPPQQTPRISEMPFTLYRGYLIMMEGRIGRLEHQNLLLDTGTSPSMIDKTISDKLGLHGSARGLSLFNQSLAAESVMLPDLQVGPLRRQNLPVMVTDFSKVQSGVGTHVDAVIGLDVLSAMSFTIDYQKRRILFRASMERHSAPFTSGSQFITVNLKTGKRQLHLLLDTGTPHLVLFKNALRDLDYDWTELTETGQNISGNVSYNTIILPQALLGNVDVGPQKASIVATREDFANQYDGLIGVYFLRPKRLSFDFTHQLLAWSN